MNDEPTDPMRDLIAGKDQYMTGYREIFIPMYKELNDMMKVAGLEVEIRAVVIGRMHERLTAPTQETY